MKQLQAAGTSEDARVEGPAAALAAQALEGSIIAARQAPPAIPPVAAASSAATAADPHHRRPRVLLAASGSVATIKLPALAALLLRHCEIKVVATRAARYFFTQDQLPPACGPALGDEDEWREWKQVGDPVMHIELRRWADALVIAPLSANTLAKIAGGLCDNLLTCVVRAWDFQKPLLVAPAMNTFMWDSPFTARHLAACTELGVTVIPPVSKRLACGDVGSGGMAAPEDIAAACTATLAAAGLMPVAENSC